MLHTYISAYASGQQFRRLSLANMWYYVQCIDYGDLKLTCSLCVCVICCVLCVVCCVLWLQFEGNRHGLEIPVVEVVNRVGQNQSCIVL